MKKTFSYTIVYKNNQKNMKIAEKINGFGLGTLDEENPEIIFSVGGDGTLLRALQKYIHLLEKVVFVPINTGTLGFLKDFLPSDVGHLLRLIDSQGYQLKQHRLLEVEVFTKTGSKVFYPLNEVRIENNRQTLKLDLQIDDCFREHLEGTGICVSSQLGASAYNRGLRGALIDQELEIMQLCEIVPVYNSLVKSFQNPFVLNGNRSIEVRSYNFEGSSLFFDHLCEELDETVTSIRISLSQRKISFMNYFELCYLEKIKKIL